MLRDTVVLVRRRHADEPARIRICLVVGFATFGGPRAHAIVADHALFLLRERYEAHKGERARMRRHTNFVHATRCPRGAVAEQASDDAAGVTRLERHRLHPEPAAQAIERIAIVERGAWDRID